MTSPQMYLGKKAAKATVKHTVHGTVSKASRNPFRTSTLLTAGALLGVGVGFLAGRRTAKPATGASPVAQPGAPKPAPTPPPASPARPPSSATPSSPPPPGPPPSDAYEGSPEKAEAPGTSPV